MWAVVPLKSPEQAKSRLSHVLPPAQRARLFAALAQHVLRTLVATPGIERVVAATASDAVRTLAQDCGAESITLARDAGTAQACAAALQQLKPRRLERLMFVAGDLPLISAPALAPLLALPSNAAFAAIVPDRRRIGTNVLLCAPPESVPLCFGPGSFDKHLLAAGHAGVAVHVLESSALSLDIDEPADLRELQRLCQQDQRSVPDALRALLVGDAEVVAQ